MPTNVPPQYRDAEQRFREAVSVQGKIAALQEMLQIMPKHKGTDHLKAQLRARLSKLMSDLETSSSGKGGRTDQPTLENLFFFPRLQELRQKLVHTN